MDCIFCKIVKQEIPTKLIYEDKDVVAFDDLHPQAPIHKLIVSREHIPTLNDLTEDKAALIGRMTLAAQTLAKQLNIAESGYRVLMNCNAGAGQTVFHIHMHLLGGRPLHWPPG